MEGTGTRCRQRQRVHWSYSSINMSCYSNSVNNNFSCLSKDSSFSATVSPITVIFTFRCRNTDDGPFISEDFMKSACLTHCYICLGNGFLLDGTGPLPQPTLINHAWRLGHLPEYSFYRKHSRYQFMEWSNAENVSISWRHHDLCH